MNYPTRLAPQTAVWSLREEGGLSAYIRLNRAAEHSDVGVDMLNILQNINQVHRVSIPSYRADGSVELPTLSNITVEI